MSDTVGGDSMDFELETQFFNLSLWFKAAT